MDEQLNRQTEFFWELLANPAFKDEQYANNLQQLIHQFPQSGILQALLLYTGDESNLHHAAAYFDPKILFKLSNTTGSLPVIDPEQIVTQLKDQPANGYFNIEEAPADEDVVETPQHAETDFEQPLFEPLVYEEDEIIDGLTEDTPIDVSHEQAEEAIIEEGLFEPSAYVEAEGGEATPEHTVTEDAPEEQPVAEIHKEPTVEQIFSDPSAYVEAENDEVLPENTIEESTPEEQPAEQIDDEVYDEIVSIEESTPEEQSAEHIDDEVYDEIVSIEDINRDYQSANTENSTEELVMHEGEPVQYNEPGLNQRLVDLNDEEEKLILNNIAATDFFVFDQAFELKKANEKAEPQPPTQETGQSVQAGVAGEIHHDVSKYHDEKMPYSFMWWLDKTRREHSATYQPYADFKPDTPQGVRKNMPDELQQQYYENIFHLTTVEELERSTGQRPFEFGKKRKEDEIIERFIQEVPQIKPQSSDKLGNENKAKKSAEDMDELVTETLASIYADQMLFDKAIGTYKKLMLKFPEKKRYFASQIEKLEKRTN